MHPNEIYEITYGQGRGTGKAKADAILGVIPGASLMIMTNINISLGKILFPLFHFLLYNIHFPIFNDHSDSLLDLVNGMIIQFYGFANDEQVQLGDIISLPQYMLVKIPGKGISIPGLPPDVIPIESIRFRYSPGKCRSVNLRQFPAILAYTIMDYKCQGHTYTCLLADLKKPLRDSSPVASLYIQLSHCQSINNLSILHPFNVNELFVPLSDALIQELNWERTKYEETLHQWRHLIV